MKVEAEFVHECPFYWIGAGEVDDSSGTWWPDDDHCTLRKSGICKGLGNKLCPLASETVVVSIKENK